MKKLGILRYLLSDSSSLRDYSSGDCPFFGDVMRHLFICARAANQQLPDHYYKQAQESDFKGINSFPTLLTEGLFRLSDAHLEIRGANIFVKKNETWPDWQELLTLCSPLVLISAFLWKKKFPTGTRDLLQLIDFIQEYIWPNVQFSALPKPYYQSIDQMENEKPFHDLHIHLNGVLPTFVWVPPICCVSRVSR